MNSCLGYEKKKSGARDLVSRAQAALKNGAVKKKTLIWLELTGCAGNIISLLDGENPGFGYLISEMADMVYSNSLMGAAGETAMRLLMEAAETDFILAVEGAVATKNNGLYTIIGGYRGQPLTALKAVTALGEKAAHVIAVGTCASDGGISAARPNPSGCVSVQSLLKRKVIKLTGCPCHPDWFMGTLAHILLYGEPLLDGRDRPLLFYSTLIHDRCPRRGDFDKGIFAKKLGDKACMFQLGCRGPITRTDCPERQWNGYVNWPVKDGTPCIGCAQFGFPDKMEPFITYSAAREV